jgi:hypothetical protein
MPTAGIDPGQGAIRRPNTRTRILATLALGSLSAFLAGCDLMAHLFPAPTDYEPFPALITRPIPQRDITRGETFFETKFNVRYWDGSLFISSNTRGDGNIFVDDAMRIRVVRPDQTEEVRVFDFSTSCAGTGPKPPLEVTELFQAGKNSVEITLYDVCGGWVGSSVLWLVHVPPRRS